MTDGIPAGERRSLNRWVAVICGCAIYALFTWISEAVLVQISGGRVFYIADIGTQFVYSAAGAVVACTLCRKPKTVFFAMSSIGMVIGAFSVVASWGASDPHWYSVILYASFVPSIGLGVGVWRWMGANRDLIET